MYGHVKHFEKNKQFTLGQNDFNRKTPTPSVPHRCEEGDHLPDDVRHVLRPVWRSASHRHAHHSAASPLHQE